MVSVSPIESDSEAGEGGIFTFSSEDSRTLVPQSNYTERDRGTGTESVYMVRPSKLVGQGLGKVKREREPRVAPSLLYPPVMTFDGDPGGWRQVRNFFAQNCLLADRQRPCYSSLSTESATPT